MNKDNLSVKKSDTPPAFPKEQKAHRNAATFP